MNSVLYRWIRFFHDVPMVRDDSVFTIVLISLKTEVLESDKKHES